MSKDLLSDPSISHIRRIKEKTEEKSCSSEERLTITRRAKPAPIPKSTSQEFNYNPPLLTPPYIIPTEHVLDSSDIRSVRIKKSKPNFFNK